MASSTLEAYHARAQKRTHELFGDESSESFLDSVAPTAKRSKLQAASDAPQTADPSEIKLSSRIIANYNHVKHLPPPGATKKNNSASAFLNTLASKSSADGTPLTRIFTLSRTFCTVF